MYIYGLALGASGAGAIVGLPLIGRLRNRMSEQQLLLLSLWLIAASSLGVAIWGTLCGAECSWLSRSGSPVRWVSPPSTP